MQPSAMSGAELRKSLGSGQGAQWWSHKRMVGSATEYFQMALVLLAAVNGEVFTQPQPSFSIAISPIHEEG